MYTGPLVVLLLFSLVIGEVVMWWYRADFAQFELLYRAYHLGQMLLLIVAATLLWPRVRGLASSRWVYGLILFGLISSFAGDVINSFLIDLSHIIEPQTLLSVVPFAIAHCLYIAAFWRLGRQGPHPFPASLILLTVLVWPVLAASLWLILVDTGAGPLLKWLSLGYAHMVVLMALCSLWPLRSFGLRAWIAAAAGLVFLLSDAFFGAWLTEGRGRPLWVSQVIWTTYFVAQVCMMHVPLIGNGRPTGK
ncbi:MAG: lysoplasmalogenase family protein [Salinisphaeraceae bacterium]|nr:lysoplasmalogenase family protein [Salinisphaeraceae bacterium]